MGRETNPTVVKSDEEWRAQLDPAAYAGLREAANERSFSGEFFFFKQKTAYEI